MPGYRWSLITGLLVAGGIAIRAVAMARVTIYHDEALVLTFLTQPWEAMLRSLHEFAYYPPGYFLVLHVCGGSEWPTRAVALACSAVALLVFARLCRDVLGAERGTLALALFVLSPLAVELSVETKMYGLELLLCVTGLWLWLGMARAGGRARVILAGLALGLAMQVHYLAVLFVGGLGAGTLLSPEERPGQRRDAVLALLLAVILQLPWALYLLTGTGGFRSLGASRGIPRGFSLDTLIVLVMGHVAWNVPAIPGLGTRSICGLTLLLCVAGVRVLRRDSSVARAATGPIVCGLAVPFAGVSVLLPSEWTYQNQVKYAIGALPCLLLIVTAGLWRLAGAWPGRALVAVFLGLSLVCAVETLSIGLRRESWRDVARALQDQRRPGEIVVVWRPYALLGLCSQRPGFEASSPEVVLLPRRRYGYPVSDAPELSLLNTPPIYTLSTQLDADREVRELAPAGALWLVLHPAPQMDANAERLLHAFEARFGKPVLSLNERGCSPALFRFDTSRGRPSP